jgi:hypothetical protein
MSAASRIYGLELRVQSYKVGTSSGQAAGSTTEKEIAENIQSSGKTRESEDRTSFYECRAKFCEAGAQRRVGIWSEGIVQKKGKKLMFEKQKCGWSYCKDDSRSLWMMRKRLAHDSQRVLDDLFHVVSTKGSRKKDA